MAKKQIPQKGTKEYHHYQRKLDANYKEALGRLKYLLKGLKPISKKMAVHHNVSPKPIKDLITIQKNYIRLKSFCNEHKYDRKVRGILKNIEPYLTFKETPFKNKVFSINIGYLVVEGENISFEDMINNIEELLDYQDSLITKKERDPKFTENHRSYNRIVNNVRTSVIYLHDKISVIYQKEIKPSRFSLRKK